MPAPRRGAPRFVLAAMIVAAAAAASGCGVNATDARMETSPAFQQQVAAALLRAIITFLR